MFLASTGARREVFTRKAAEVASNHAAARRPLVARQNRGCAQIQLQRPSKLPQQFANLALAWKPVAEALQLL
jgi:hypothetical protein